ncbi:12262_t:CDS:1, partial [Funneliformis geosporum]
YTNLQGQYSRVQLRVEHLECNSDTQYVQDLQQEINLLRQNFAYTADQLQQRSQEFNFSYDFHFH